MVTHSPFVYANHEDAMSDLKRFSDMHLYFARPLFLVNSPRGLIIQSRAEEIFHTDLVNCVALNGTIFVRESTTQEKS